MGSNPRKSMVVTVRASNPNLLLSSDKVSLLIKEQTSLPVYEIIMWNDEQEKRISRHNYVNRSLPEDILKA